MTAGSIADLVGPSLLPKLPAPEGEMLVIREDSVDIDWPDMALVRFPPVTPVSGADVIFAVKLVLK